MSLQCLTDDVSIGDLFLNHMDEDGNAWRLGNIEGWWTLPESEFVDAPRGWDDGSYDTAGRYLARSITLTGWIDPVTKAAAPAARAQLFRTIDLCRKSAWLITRETGRTVGSVVRISGQPLIDSVVQSGRIDFSIGLRANDPVKYSLNGDTAPGWYSDSITGPGTLTIANEGNFEVYPTLTITGPTDGPVQIINHTTGYALVVQSLVPSGSDLVIDVKNRSVTLDGARNKRNYLRWDTDWPQLLALPNEIEFAAYSTDTPAAADAATLTVQWRHGWIA